MNEARKQRNRSAKPFGGEASTKQAVEHGGRSDSVARLIDRFADSEAQNVRFAIDESMFVLLTLFFLSSTEQ